MKKKLTLLALVVTAFILIGFIATLKIPLANMALGSGIAFPFIVGKTYYDPDPRRRTRRRGGGLPKSLIKKFGISKKAWQVFRLQKGRTADPRRRSMARGYGKIAGKPFRIGARRGVAWSGGTKLRYDPDIRRRFGGYYRRARGWRGFGKIEGLINKHASKLGFLFGLGVPTWQAYKKYSANIANVTPQKFIGIEAWKPEDYAAIGYEPSSIKSEILTLFGQPNRGRGAGEFPIDKYLEYKFLNDESVWKMPFWASLATWIGTAIANRLPIPSWAKRITKPLNGFSKGSLVGSAIGALTICGCPEPRYPIPPPPNSQSARNVGMNTMPQNPKNYVYGK